MIKAGHSIPVSAKESPVGRQIRALDSRQLR